MASKTAKTVAVIGASAIAASSATRRCARSASAATPWCRSTRARTRSKACPRIRACSTTPGAIDEATVYVPADVGVKVLDEIAKKGISTVWLNPGADDPASSRARASSDSSRSRGVRFAR